MRPVFFLGVAWVWMLAWPALAQEGRFDVQSFRPLGAPQDVLAVGQSRALSPHSVSAGAFLHFALEPLVNAFEDAILQANKYERNTAMMMPPPGSTAPGFISDSVKGNPAELVWGQPYPFVEAKARKQLSLSGNLEAMLRYVETYGDHLELWVRSSRHPDGPTHLSSPLLDAVNRLKTQGKAIVKPFP